MRRAMIVAVLAAMMPVAAAATQVTEKTATFSFDHRWPDAASRVAPLRRWLEADRDRLRARTAALADADRRDAAKSGYPFRPHTTTREWKLVTETPRLLSLSGTTYRFTGGAHGNTVTEALLWDKTGARRVDPRALFVSPTAVQRAFGARWCAWLKRERARRLGETPTNDTMFRCPPLSDLKLLMGSTDGRAIDRIGLIADQYVAGSYAEGVYELTVPVTPAVRRAVKPAWQAAFAR